MFTNCEQFHLEQRLIGDSHACGGELGLPTDGGKSSLDSGLTHRASKNSGGRKITMSPPSLPFPTKNEKMRPLYFPSTSFFSPQTLLLSHAPINGTKNRRIFLLGSFLSSHSPFSFPDSLMTRRRLSQEKKKNSLG